MRKLITLLCLCCPTIIILAQTQLDVQGNISSTDTVAKIVVAYNGPVDVVGLKVSAIPANDKGIGAIFYGGFRGLIGQSQTGRGIIGESVNSSGVFGSSVTGAGLYGKSVHYRGVYGLSDYGTGIVGESSTLYGVWGISSSRAGVRGVSESGNGVAGESTNLYGVYGKSSNNIGVYGESTNTVLDTTYGGFFDSYSNYGRGVAGRSVGENGIGVYGYTSGKFSKAVWGQSTGSWGVGLFGYSKSDSLGWGIFGSADGKYGTGVYGFSAGSEGFGIHGKANEVKARAVFGESTNGYAGYFSGDVKISGSQKGLEFPDGSTQTTAFTGHDVFYKKQFSFLMAPNSSSSGQCLCNEGDYVIGGGWDAVRNESTDTRDEVTNDYYNMPINGGWEVGIMNNTSHWYLIYVYAICADVNE